MARMAENYPWSIAGARCGLRRDTDKGLPCGSETFVRKLAMLTG